jgi:hypothetical protein
MVKAVTGGLDSTHVGNVEEVLVSFVVLCSHLHRCFGPRPRCGWHIASAAHEASHQHWLQLERHRRPRCPRLCVSSQRCEREEAERRQAVKVPVRGMSASAWQCDRVAVRVRALTRACAFASRTTSATLACIGMTLDRCNCWQGELAGAVALQFRHHVQRNTCCHHGGPMQMQCESRLNREFKIFWT